MSERIKSAPSADMDVDSAFDAEKRQAQNEWNDYLKGRDYQDANGSIHDSESGRFKADPNNESDDEYYNRLHEESESNVDTRFAGKGLKSLAEMVRDARAVGDKTTEIDARAAFDDAFIAAAEKYGWEGVVETDNGNGTTTVDDRNEIADRRLAYFTKIMDGDVQTAENSSEAAEATDTQPETRPETTESSTQTDAERETADRAAMMRVIRSLARDDIDDDELERALDLFTNPSRRTTAPAAPATAAASTDRENEALQRIADGEPMEDVTRDVNEVPDVDMGDDLDEIPVDVGNQTSVDTRTRGQRARDRIRQAGHNLRYPGAYLGGRMSGALHERRGANRNAIIVGVIGAAALTAAALRMFGGGGGGNGAPNAVVDVLNDNLNGSYNSAPEPNEEILNVPTEVMVDAGDGEIRTAKAILAEMGVTVNTKEAELIGEHAGVDLLFNDKNYDDAQSELNRIGGAPGMYQIRPGSAEALYESAKELGYIS